MRLWNDDHCWNSTFLAMMPKEVMPAGSSANNLSHPDISKAPATMRSRLSNRTLNSSCRSSNFPVTSLYITWPELWPFACSRTNAKKCRNGLRRHRQIVSRNQKIGCCMASNVPLYHFDNLMRYARVSSAPSVSTTSASYSVSASAPTGPEQSHAMMS